MIRVFSVYVSSDLSDALWRLFSPEISAGENRNHLQRANKQVPVIRLLTRINVNCNDSWCDGPPQMYAA